MSSDRIRLVNMSFYGHHGVDREERRLGKKLCVDVELALDLTAAGASDDLTRTVDYAAVYALVREIEGAKEYHLLEALAEDIAGQVLARFPAREVTVRVRKPEAPLGGLVDYVEVEILRRKEA